jgi:hypothetical protein
MCVYEYLRANDLTHKPRDLRKVKLDELKDKVISVDNDLSTTP